MAHDRSGILTAQPNTDGFRVRWTALNKARGLSGPISHDGFYGPIAAADGAVICAGLYILAEEGKPGREVAVVRTYDGQTFISTIDDEKCCKLPARQI